MTGRKSKAAATTSHAAPGQNEGRSERVLSQEEEEALEKSR